MTRSMWSCVPFCALLMATVAIVAALFLPAGANRSVITISPETCTELIREVDKLVSGQTLVIDEPKQLVCSEALVFDVNDTVIDLGNSHIMLADDALRPVIVVGGLHKYGRSPERRHNITVKDVSIDGNRYGQAEECWGGPCDETNGHMYARERNNGVTVNSCDDCAVFDVKVANARSGGMVTVGARRLWVKNFTAEGSYFDGLAGYWTFDSVFEYIRVADNRYSGFSFDLHFSGNRIEQFEAMGNGDHGVFIRAASGNDFVYGRFSGNGGQSVYLDSPDGTIRMCANNTSFKEVGLRSVHWQFPCTGTTFIDAAPERCMGRVPDGYEDVCGPRFGEDEIAETG